MEKRSPLSSISMFTISETFGSSVTSSLLALLNVPVINIPLTVFTYCSSRELRSPKYPFPCVKTDSHFPVYFSLKLVSSIIQLFSFSVPFL